MERKKKEIYQKYQNALRSDQFWITDLWKFDTYDSMSSVSSLNFMAKYNTSWLFTPTSDIGNIGNLAKQTNKHAGHRNNC